MLTLLTMVVGAALAAPTQGSFRFEARGSLDCTADPCSQVLPAATDFSRPEGKPYVVGTRDGETVGWVGLSSDLTEIDGYSGKPLHTLVGIDTDGYITGATVVHHSEPILLVGIPESELQDFVAKYTGLRVDEKVVVGAGSSDAKRVDAISGATVTVLAQNRTVLDSARALAEDVGVLHGVSQVPGHFVEAEPWTWQQLTRSKALGHLVVTAEQMAQPPADRPYLDLWFGIADAPQVGIPLLGERTWRYHRDRLEDGEHLLVMFNGGTGSFKGSGFVRGGIFDRVRIEQGLRTMVFRDHDYTKLDSPKAEGAPFLGEGALFITRDHLLDPGASYDLMFLGSTITGAFARDFHTFKSSHRLPRSVYVLDGPDPETMMWQQAWAAGWKKAAAVGAWLLFVGGLFVGRRWMSGDMHRLHTLHTTVMTGTFLGLGLYLHVQPSVTQLLTIFGSLSGEWKWSLFLSDPVLFVFWCFIAVVTMAWGRGVFCGWLCPYGAFNELLFKLGQWAKLGLYELPDAVHFKARYLRYVIFAGLLATYLYSPELGERAAEIEPFKSTFYVAPWTRHWALLSWWVVLAGASLVWYRPFCRYICPLGAALALPSSFRASGPYRRDFCFQGCQICTRGCEPRAIRPDGTIDPRECLNCWECEANWRDDQVCPPLVKERRDREKAAKNFDAAGSISTVAGGQR